MLRHIRLAQGVSYHQVGSLQRRIVDEFLAAKAGNGSAPRPTLITTSFQPIYTCGRREIPTVTTEQESRLRSTGADFATALRGGQTTFHGPGQLIAYPILDLRAHGLGARRYVELLERTIIATLARYRVKGMTTENPGVWTTAERKIAALGIHLRRNVSSHGIALNVDTDLNWFDHIVACGLEGKETTSLAHEGVKNVDVEDVRQAFVQDFVKNLDGVDQVIEESVDLHAP